MESCSSVTSRPLGTSGSPLDMSRIRALACIWILWRRRLTTGEPIMMNSRMPMKGMRKIASSQAMAEEGRRFCGTHPRATNFRT